MFCKIYHDATKKTGDDIRSYDVVDSDEIAGITDVDDGDDEPGNGGKKRTYYSMTDAGREYYKARCEEWALTKEVVEQFIKKEN